jgi:isopenicillin-N N-acyltransferase-like protein
LLGAKHPLGVEDIQTFLRDHQAYPHGVCRHEDPDLPPGERYCTVTSAIMDLDAQVLYLSDGPPCQSEYQRVSL